LQQNKCSELVDKFAPILNTDDDIPCKGSAERMECGQSTDTTVLSMITHNLTLRLGTECCFVLLQCSVL